MHIIHEKSKAHTELQQNVRQLQCQSMQMHTFDGFGKVGNDLMAVIARKLGGYMYDC